ncbi:YgcG family protein [Methylobacterium sp. NEAU K]|uniref:TPM domain-containing protein n=1 Tax=Methylobacterium sp. NEAU K TaxID=3064946 RepID=UPI0027331E84|nr:TPM domain-containing protein [Methylobacterium sp. NEAU K]MDP4004553.1 TPM domain-containing protein [Methylobacterium sp. NEAU K]
MGRSIPTRVRLALALGVLAVCLAVYAVGALAADLTFPALTGRVVDAAGILTPDQRGKLDAKLKAHEDKTSDQVVVATVPNLQGTTVEDYANRLFRAWKLGQAKTNNGALLLVAPAERKVRIEVGYGLEGALTDALTRVIIASAITPRFKTGDYYGGLDAGVDGMLSILSGDAQEWQRKPQVRTDEVDPAQVAALVLLFLVVLFVAWRMTRGGNRGGPAGRRGGIVLLPGPGSGGWSGGFSDGGSSGGFGGGFSGGGGSSGGGGASGDW